MRRPAPLRLVSSRSRVRIAAIAGAALLVPLLVAVVTGCSRSPSSADEAAADVAAIVAARQRLCDLKGENTARAEGIGNAEAAASEANSGPLPLLDKSSHLSAAEQEELAKLYRKEMQPSIAELRGEIDKHDRYVKDQVSPSWIKLAAEWQRVHEKRGAFEREKRKSQQSALALGTENRWFWLSALVALAVLMVMVFLENRHDVRRWLNGGQARALGLGKWLVVAFALLCLLTAALFFASDGILVDILDRSGSGSAGAWAADGAKDAEEIAEAESRQTSQLQQLEQIREKLLETAHKLVPRPQAAAVVDTWWEQRQLEEKRRAQLVSLEENRQQFAGMVKELRDDDTAITADRDAAVGWRKYASRISGGIGLAILGLLGAGAFKFQRGVIARKRTLAATCPNCLGVGKLEPAGGGDGMLRCTNVITETPAFIECDFQFPSHLQSQAKLSFPTLGVPSSGKTFWLSMTYDRLTSRDYPPEVNFTPVRTDQTAAIEKIVRDILNEKVSPAATQTPRVPPPLCLDFSDKDRLGESSVLVNLFDYSGEVSQAFTLADHQRRRAFSADGYLWFVDPTSDKQSNRIEVTDQKNALARFESDVRQVKNLRAGQQLHRPIAICVSKIDIMINERYGKEGDIVQQFYAELGEIGWGMDVESIQARSDAMESLANTIWPNWAIKRAVNELFGGRCMFFPLSPVGLDQPGETDLRKRDIAPVGILHPLMWLLHMNGYPVLPPRRASK